jgi:hemerythrin-like domain-containing protein
VCEYCGCQALESVRILTEEHDQVVNLIGAARSARRRGDLTEHLKRCQEILAVLGPHTRVEEGGLFPAMAVDFPDQIAALVDDHKHIHAVLEHACDTTAALDPDWPDQVEAVFVLLREHILREQDGVFPAALFTLTTDQWDALDQMRSSGAAGPR